MPKVLTNDGCVFLLQLFITKKTKEMAPNNLIFQQPTPQPHPKKKGFSTSSETPFVFFLGKTPPRVSGFPFVVVSTPKPPGKSRRDQTVDKQWPHAMDHEDMLQALDSSQWGLYLRCLESFDHVGVSKNSGTPKSSILIGFSIINHPFWGTPIFGNAHVHSLKLTVRTWKWMVGIRSFPFGKEGLFSGANC